jgi:hypothetical protein
MEMKQIKNSITISYKLSDSISLNLFDGEDEKLIKVETATEYYTFIQSKEFQKLAKLIIKDIYILQKDDQNKLLNLDVSKLFEKYIDNIDDIEFDSSFTFLPFRDMLLGSILKKFEIKVGDLLLKRNDFKNYSEIKEFSSMMLNINEYLTLNKMINFTQQQDNQDKYRKKIYKVNLLSFRRYLHLFIENEK